MQITFTCKSGSLSGKKFEFNEPVITIGREQSSMIKFDSVKDPRVSAAHCEVFLQDDKFYVRDKGSMNGTLVNGAPITAPTLLRDGAILKLGDKGPEFTISIIREDGLDGTLLNTMKKAQSVPPAASPAVKPTVAAPVETPAKKVIGELTLERKLGEAQAEVEEKLRKAKAEVRKEYASKGKRMIAMIAGVLVLALAISALIYWKHSGEIVAIKGEVDVLKRNIAGIKDETEKNIAEFKGSIKETVEKNAAEWRAKDNKYTDAINTSLKEIAELKKEADTQKKLTGIIRNETKHKLDELKKKVTDTQNDFQEYQVKNDMMLEKAKNPFAGYQENFGDAVYSIVVKFEEDGKPQEKLVATAFAVSVYPALLATSAHVANGLNELRSRGYEICARCKKIDYRIAKIASHPDYDLRNGSTASKDVAILEVDLPTKDGNPSPLPKYLPLASNEELDEIKSGENILMFGFKAAEAVRQPMLDPGTVGSIQTFNGELATGHNFDFLQHNCRAQAGNSGSPVLNDNGRVVAIQNSGMMAMNLSGALAPVSSYAVNVSFLRELCKQRYPKDKYPDLIGTEVICTFNRRGYHENLVHNYRLVIYRRVLRSRFVC